MKTIIQTKINSTEKVTISIVEQGGTFTSFDVVIKYGDFTEKYYFDTFVKAYNLYQNKIRYYIFNE